MTDQSLAWAVLGALLASGCSGVDVSEEESPRLGTAEQEIGGNNGFDGNSIKNATISSNSTYAQALVNNPLSTSSMASRSAALRNTIVAEADSNTVFDMIVRCALSDGDTVDVSNGTIVRRFYGEYGIANNWKTGACGPTCQENVTACVIANSHQSNVDYQHIQIDLVNNTWPGSPTFPLLEGLYFGNLFASTSLPPRILGCKFSGTTDLISRVCGDTSNGGGCSIMTDPMIATLGLCVADYGCNEHYNSPGDTWNRWYDGCGVNGRTYNNPLTLFRRDQLSTAFGAVFYTKSGDRSGGTISDWDVGYWKATCKSAEILTGVSVKVDHAAAHAALCESSPGSTPPTGQIVLSVPGGDRRANRLGDWDVNNWKLECPSGSRVSGVSQDNTVPGSNFHAIRCTARTDASSPIDYMTGCETRLMDGGAGDRGDNSAGDWDYGYQKSECSDGKAIVGVSVNPSTSKLSKILCCRPQAQ